jgi:DNA-binding FadR family transcriptional regulator
MTTFDDLRPLQVRNAPALVADDLRRRIITGEFAPGELLPFEAELAKKYGISRATIREAMAVLQSESLISVRRGAGGGARVLRPDITSATRYTGQLLQSLGATIKDVYEARLMMEPPVVRKFAATRSAADVLALREIIDQQVDDDPAASRRVASQFLDEIFRRAGNLTMWVLARQLNDIAMMHAASASIIVAPDMATRWARNGQRARARLTNLIDNRAAEEAERFWASHLKASHRELSEAGQPSAVEVVNRVP